MRPSQYLAGALAGIAVVFGYAGQIGDNLVYLAERDLEKERKKQMADNKIQQAATETLDTELTDVQTEVHDLVPLISNLIADDASQKSRGDALQAAIDALKATAPDDTARIAILEDLKANLTPAPDRSDTGPRRSFLSRRSHRPPSLPRSPPLSLRRRLCRRQMAPLRQVPMQRPRPMRRRRLLPRHKRSLIQPGHPADSPAVFITIHY